MLTKSHYLQLWLIDLFKRLSFRLLFKLALDCLRCNKPASSSTFSTKTFVCKLRLKVLSFCSCLKLDLSDDLMLFLRCFQDYSIACYSCSLISSGCIKLSSSVSSYSATSIVVRQYPILVVFIKGVENSLQNYKWANKLLILALPAMYT